MSRSNLHVTNGVIRVAPEATGSAKALVKGVALVEAIAAADGPVQLHRLVDITTLPRPTVIRLLKVLHAAELLSVDGHGGYWLGPRVAAWGQRYLERLDVRLVARDVMEELASLTRETCFLGVRTHMQVLYVAKAGGDRPVRLGADVGSLGPLYSTGVGKALLAFASDDVVDDLLARPLRQWTPNTMADPTRLRDEFAMIRTRGYSTDDVENEEGVRCVAVPIRGAEGLAVAAMSVAAPAYRFSVDHLHQLAPRMLAAATVVSERLGFPQATVPVPNGR